MNRVKELTNESAISKDDLTVLINGNRAKTSELFLEQIFALLNFPEKKYKNWDAYIGWMRDLSWIKNKKINIIISDWSDFLCEDEKINKNIFVEDYNEDILPYWEKASVHDNSDRYTKDLDVYYTDKSFVQIFNCFIRIGFLCELLGH